MALAFSNQPGCWERHLQRRSEWPDLFSLPAVNQAAVDEAFRKDERERIEAANQFQDLLRDAASLSANVESEQILDLKTKIDKLYQHCMGLGGALEEVTQALLRLHAVIMDAIRKGAANDTVAQAEIEEELTFHQAHIDLLAHPIVAHLLRQDGPIVASELAAALLCEQVESVRAAVSIFDSQQLDLLLTDTTQLATKFTEDDPRTPQLREKIQVIADYMRELQGTGSQLV